ncbi:hypothetical protein HYX08_01585 [Candidatus Woesearchaeota archaeon]|nr:hypothetical protein [Candidatus Woesearchaeota archaeon]
MEKPPISFFAMSFVLLFVLVSLIFAVFDLHRFAFVFELGILLVLLTLAALSMLAIYHGRLWGWTIMSALLILILVNLLFIYLITGAFGTSHLTALVFSLIGLGVSLFNLREPQNEQDGMEIEEYEKAKDYYPYIDKMEPIEEPKVEKTFTPGKFVASRKANKFHAPKCDWAKRIGKENQIWFDSEQEAKAKGFEADKCVA